MKRINGESKTTLEIPEKEIVYSGKLGIKKKIQWTLWKFSKDGSPEFMGRGKVRYGKRIFKWKGQEYLIDYNLIKHGKRWFEYDHDVSNALGGLAFSKNKDNISPNQLEEFIEALSENVFTARRGIPAMVLYVAMIIALIGVGGLAYFAMQYAELTTLGEMKDRQIISLQNSVTTLNNRITELQSGVIN